jgi:hypothetical protein
MTTKNSELVTTISILTRRLKEGKTYDDFRKAWYHTTGFGVKGKEVEGSGNRMFSIDVRVRLENPLDDVIEPEIGRKFCALISEDDFSAVGDIPYKPPGIAGKQTNMAEFDENLHAIQELYAVASQKRDAVNEARKKQK